MHAKQNNIRFNLYSVVIRVLFFICIPVYEVKYESKGTEDDIEEFKQKVRPVLFLSLFLSDSNSVGQCRVSDFNKLKT